MRRRVVAGNWKMHGSIASIGRLLDELVPLQVPKVDVMVFPPVVYLASVVQRLRGSGIWVGAQNVHSERSGAFTAKLRPR